MSQIKRRHFLKGSTALYAGGLFSYNDFFKLVNQIAATTIQKARADVIENQSKNYLNLHLSGGPTRFMFDQWLTPDALDNSFVLGPENSTYWNPGVATAINNNSLEYKLYTYRGIRVPHHFQYPVQTSKGSTSLEKLLDHMAVIRGYSSGTDGHEVNNPIQTYPDPSAPSLHGLAADYRKDLVSAINYNNQMPFSSGSGKVASAIVNHGGIGGSIGGLMSVFQKYVPQSSVINNLDQLSGSRLYFREIMQQAMKSYDRTTANAIHEHISAGEKLIQLAAEDLNRAWTDLLLKYTNAINKSSQIVDGVGGPIPFLTDKAITIPDAENNKLDTIDVNRSYDLREMFNSSSGMSVPNDAARIFALYEYSLSRGISGVLSGASGSTVLNSPVINTASTKNIFSIHNDQHTILPRVNILSAASYYRGLMGGLLELVDYLKSNTGSDGKDLFSQTVIHITGDFTRSPRDDMAGYDHGWNSQTTSIISGAVQAPSIVGNIKKTGVGGYKGIWGIAEAMDFNGSKEVLSPRHVAAAIANILNVPNPWIFTHKVWELSNNVLQTKVGAKII